MKKEIAEPMQIFRSILSRYAQIPETEWRAFESFVRSRKIKKNSHLLKPNQISRKLTYICEGLMRMYEFHDGEEINVSFFSERSLANSFISFIKQQPSEYGIQALEDTTVLTINYDAMMKLNSKHSCWQELALGASMFKLKEKEKKENRLLNYTAEERYLEFMNNYPQILNRIPQYHLASYLGVKPESLSRIRKQLIPSNFTK